jgi:hypothetical protein
LCDSCVLYTRSRRLDHRRGLYPRGFYALVPRVEACRGACATPRAKFFAVAAPRSLETPAAMAPWAGRRLLAATAAAAAGLLWTPSVVQAQGGTTCYTHSDCPRGQYCDTSLMCYSCTYVNPSSCDAIDYDCCGRDLLQNCPSDPADCGGGGPPPPPAPPTPPPPAPSPAPRRCIDKGTQNLRLSAASTVGAGSSVSSSAGSRGDVQAQSSTGRYVWEGATRNWAAESFRTTGLCEVARAGGEVVLGSCSDGLGRPVWVKALYLASANRTFLM